ncbi:MAG TPA: redox-sensing transcriptional repressor Rex [Rectinema sp.]|nr:redox-sensing transcriptional repressor Rex [Rectinema sp.]HPB07378.1 redox-sensing transcriptional repressor Rex [Rectinema sp.]HQK09267.1 redox-sensing transcriptional repressor Rex [Rectinema sp.]
MSQKTKLNYVPSIRRFPSYLHIIRAFQRTGEPYISGTWIANELNLEPIQVRKDLSITGIVGKPKKGYPVDQLIAAIEHYLAWDIEQRAMIVGAGNLGSALTGYQEFRNHGLHIIAAFDSDPLKVGKTIHQIQVYQMNQLKEIVERMKITLAILTVPSPYAQSSCDAIIAAGIKAIWNFTNVKLKVPDDVIVQREDLSSGYAILSVMMRTKAKLS